MTEDKKPEALSLSLRDMTIIIAVVLGSNGGGLLTASLDRADIRQDLERLAERVDRLAKALEAGSETR